MTDECPLGWFLVYYCNDGLCNKVIAGMNDYCDLSRRCFAVYKYEAGAIYWVYLFGRRNYSLCNKFLNNNYNDGLCNKVIDSVYEYRIESEYIWVK